MQKIIIVPGYITQFISIQATYQGKPIWFDATARMGSFGRFINHAARGGNLILRPPIFARGKVHIGFVAARGRSCFGTITSGEVHRKHMKPGGFLTDPMNASLTFNTDGAKCINPRVCLWPAYFMINELLHTSGIHKCTMYKYM